MVTRKLNTYHRNDFAPMHWALLVVVLLLMTSPVSQAEDFLSTGEIASIAGGAGVLLWLNHQAGRSDSVGKSWINGPLPMEASLQRLLGGQYRVGKRHFLDNSAGSAYTPIAAGFLLASADLSWPRNNRGKEIGQDLFLYTTGLLATKGVTGIFKNIVSRPRPLLCLEPELAGQRETIDNRYDHQAFPSGHTSSAFFASAYLNLRLRAIMRQELHAGEYRDYRWAPPTLLFSWATLVGWSRIHAYKHFVSDVVAGAAVGVLMAELFYRFADDPEITGDAGGEAPILVSYRWTF